MRYLFLNLPVWACVTAFICGAILGWVLRGVYAKSDRGVKIGIESVIQMTVFVIWATATSRAAIYDGVEYPPLFLNVMFGAIVGSMNKGLGDWILKFIKELTGRK